LEARGLTRVQGRVESETVPAAAKFISRQSIRTGDMGISKYPFLAYFLSKIEIMQENSFGGRAERSYGAGDEGCIIVAVQER
jgi:hypothetical protein